MPQAQNPQPAPFQQPTGAIPQFGAIPSTTGNVPTGAIPTGTMPTGAMQTGTMQTGAAPTGTVPPGTTAAGNMPAGAAPNGGQPSQTQRLYKEIVTPSSLKAMGSSLGFGLGAALVLALANAGVLAAVSQGAMSSMMNNLGDFSELLDVKSSNFFHTVITMLVAGVAGSFSLKASALGVSTDDLGAKISMWLPMSLSGVALLIGAAFGAYFIAHRVGIRFKFTGIASAGVVGLATGLVYIALGALFPMSSSASMGIAKGEAALNGATVRTFIMAFVISAFGSLLGYALAQYASDSTNVFRAAWRWGHRLRGPARTFVEAFSIYAIAYTIIGLIALVVVSIYVKTPVAILLVPVVMPYLQFILLDFSSFGGIATSGSDNAVSITFGSLFSAKPWVFILAAVIFILITFYIALRASARASQDKFYAKWEHTWKAPVGMFALWLLVTFVLANMGMSASSDSGSLAIVSWFPLVAAAWAFVIEAVAMTFGPALLVSMPGLWQFVRGGCVEATPQSINAYVDACGARFKHLGEDETDGTAAAPNPVSSNMAATASESMVSGTSTSAVPMPGQTAPGAVQPFPEPNQAGGNAQAFATGPIPNGPAYYPSENLSAATSAAPGNAVSLEDFSVAPPVATGAGTDTKAMDAKQKRIVIICAAIVGACVLLGIAYSVLSSTIFSPKTVVNQYTSAIAAGDFDRANTIADPQTNGAKAKLLTNKAAKHGSTISNARVTSTKRNSDGSTSVGIAYTLSGKTHNETLTVVSKSRKMLIFDNWAITTPLVTNLRIAAPDAVGSLNINGISVSGENSSGNGGASKNSGKTYDFKAYPGIYTVKAAASDYMTSNTLTLQPDSLDSNSDNSGADAVINVKPTDKLEDAVNEAVKRKIDDCASSTDADPDGCPFGESYYESNSSYSDFSWSVNSYPKVDDVNMENSSFSTESNEGEMKLYYKYRFFDDDDWESENTNCEISEITGTFTITNNKVKVSFDDDD